MLHSGVSASGGKLASDATDVYHSQDSLSCEHWSREMSGFHVDQIRELVKYRPDAVSAGDLGYFTAPSNTHFRTLEDGTRIFYPHGALGRRGYVVVSVVMEQRLAGRVKALRKISAAACAPFALGYVLLDLDPAPLRLVGVIGGLFAMGWVVTEVVFRSFTRRMKRMWIANSPLEQWRKMGQTVRPAPLMVAGTVAITMSICGFLTCVFRRNAVGIPVGVLMAIASIPYGIALWSRWRPQSQARRRGTDSH